MKKRAYVLPLSMVHWGQGEVQRQGKNIPEHLEATSEG